MSILGQKKVLFRPCKAITENGPKKHERNKCCESEGYFYRPQKKSAKVMFSQAFVCPQEGVCIQAGLHRRDLQRGVCIQSGVCIQGVLHRGGAASRGSASGAGGLHPGGLHPVGVGGSASRGGWVDPPLDTMGYGQRVGGTHPTGMHSCSSKHSI